MGFFNKKGFKRKGMFNNLPQLIEALKNFGGFRFYFLSLIITLMILIYLFKDDIASLLEKKEEIVQHRRIRDLNGLDLLLSELFISEIHNNYLVFLYQPRIDPIIKSLELMYDIRGVSNPSRLRIVSLDSQPTLNTLFRQGKYSMIVLSKDHPKPDLEYLHHLGLDYILVVELEYYSAEIKDYMTIGEIHFSFRQEPTNEQISTILKGLEGVTNKYVINE